MKKKLMLLPVFIFLFSIMMGFSMSNQVSEPSVPAISTPVDESTSFKPSPSSSIEYDAYDREARAKVKIKPSPVLAGSEAPGKVKPGKVVYITIDDGPNPIITDKMLDILKEYNVKATFFVVGRNAAAYEDLLKRIHDEGHGIGLHSYTHDIKYVYENPDNLVNEMVETSDLIYKVLGIRPKAIRFPGGSFNHLNKPYLDRLHELGFKIFDWTISGGDGSYPYNSPYLIFANATYADSLTNRAILLMHTKPNNANSVEALPSIIEFYKNNGYEFKTIDDDTAEYYYNMKSLQ